MAKCLCPHENLCNAAGFCRARRLKIARERLEAAKARQTAEHGPNVIRFPKRGKSPTNEP